MSQNQQPSEHEELAERLRSFPDKPDRISKYSSSSKCVEVCEDIADTGEEEEYGGLCQFTTNDGIKFFPASKTVDRIPAGVYDVKHSDMRGLYFNKIPVKTEGLIRFPETNSERVIHEIEAFWDREDLFRQYDLTYKRGIILWGPPGSGKSCTVQLIMADVIAREGVVMRFDIPHFFIEGYRQLREIMPKVPVVVIMEDIESTLEQWSESEVLNILDGVNALDKVVFLATTNYPEHLGQRIINRPSRFDRRYRMGHPGAESRKIYFEHLINQETVEKYHIDIEKWVRDTEDMSIAHLKELFISTCIFGNDYEEAISVLRSMVEDKPKSTEDSLGKMGFSR